MVFHKVPFLNFHGLFISKCLIIKLICALIKILSYLLLVVSICLTAISPNDKQ